MVAGAIKLAGLGAMVSAGLVSQLGGMRADLAPAGKLYIDRVTEAGPTAPIARLDLSSLSIAGATLINAARKGDRLGTGGVGVIALASSPSTASR